MSKTSRSVSYSQDCPYIYLDPLSPFQTRENLPSVLPETVRRGILEVLIRFLFYYLSLPYPPLPTPAAFQEARNRLFERIKPISEGGTW